MSTPPSRTCPPVGSSNPERTLRSVVFPDPEGPTIATASPAFTVKETPFKIFSRRFPSQYTLLIPDASILVSLFVSLITQRFHGTEASGHERRIKRREKTQAHRDRKHRQRIGRVHLDRQAVKIINFFGELHP